MGWAIKIHGGWTVGDGLSLARGISEGVDVEES